MNNTFNLCAASVEEVSRITLETLESLSYQFDTKGENGYTMECFANYDDRLTDKAIALIVDQPDPENAFYETLDDNYMDVIEHEYNEIVRAVEEYIVKSGFMSNTCQWHDTISELIHEHLTVQAPYSHYLKQTYKVNIVMDTGDGNNLYTLNTKVGDHIDQKAGIAWLASTQGYSAECLRDAVVNGNTQSVFLRSVKRELEETCSDCNCVCFLVKMPLEKLLNINTLIKWQARKGMFYDATKRPDCGTLHIGKDTVNGLFDISSGAGSLFEIELEKDIDIPIRFVRSATPDVNECQGIRYCVGDVYGMTECQWKETSGKVTFPVY